LPKTSKAITAYLFGLLCGLAFRNHIKANAKTIIKINAAPTSRKNPVTVLGIV
jgi:hypothetical protein